MNRVRHQVEHGYRQYIDDQVSCTAQHEIWASSKQELARAMLGDLEVPRRPTWTAETIAWLEAAAGGQGDLPTALFATDPTDPTITRLHYRRVVREIRTVMRSGGGIP